MSATRIANRYAKALYRLTGGDVNKAKSYLEQTQAARALFDIEPAKKVLLSPVMPQDLKKKLFDAAFEASKGSDELRAFVGALISAGRVELYPLFVLAFAKLINEATGTLDADVVTAVPVDAAVIEKLTASLEKLLGTKIHASQQVDPELLGGFVVRLGNRMIDMSVKTKLDALSKSAAL
jgi:F-type H+-transporting ATPase subunit delta